MSPFSSWSWKLNPGQQALLVLVHLRKGETFASLAAGSGVGTATAWRYVEETVALLAARAPRLRKADRDAARAGRAWFLKLCTSRFRGNAAPAPWRAGRAHAW